MDPMVMYDEVIGLLSELVQTDSQDPPGDTSECIGVLSRYLGKEGIPFEIIEPKSGIQSIVVRIEGTKTGCGHGKTLLFNGHVDTVPFGEGWSCDPLGALIEGGFLYGRGSTDMKAGIAAGLMSCIDVYRRGRNFRGTILFTAVGDEEYHSQYGTKWLLSQGLTADCAINCEPTNLDICLGNRGLLMIDVIVKGRSAHGGRPHLGKNAVTLGSEIINALETLDFESGRDDHFKDPVGSLSIVGIRGGERINVIPDRCVFYIDRRLMPRESSEEAISQIEDTVEKVTGVRPGRDEREDADVIIKPEVWHEPFWMDRDLPFIRDFINEYRNYFGREPEFEGKSAGTDASHLVKIGGIPTVIFGPGDYRRSHTIDERVELSQVMKAMGFYSHFIEHFLD